MSPRSTLAAARRRAGLTQRQLAQRTRVPQSTIGRIETGAIDPKASTLDRLLRACGSELEAVPRLGEGIDRSLIRNQLRLTPRQRLENASAAAGSVSRIRAGVRASQRRP